MKLTIALLSLSVVLSFVGCGEKPSSNNSVIPANSNNPAPAKTAAPQPVADIRSINFESETYETSACREKVGIPQTIKFTVGKFKSDSQYSTFAEIRPKMIWGDVDGDGVEEAVVAIYCGSRDNRDSFEIQVFTAENKKPKLVARVDETQVENEFKKNNPTGWVNAVVGMEVKDGRLMVKVTTADKPRSGTTHETTFTYKLSDGKFVLEGKPSKVSDESKTKGESGK